MVNPFGGKKHKRMKKINEPIKRIFRYKQESEEYGIIEKAVGNCRFSIKCYDGKVRLGQLRGGQKKMVRIQKDDWVLIGKREFETSDDRCDILCKYGSDDISTLKTELKGFYTTFKGLDNENTDENGQENEESAFDFEDI